MLVRSGQRGPYVGARNSVENGYRRGRSDDLLGQALASPYIILLGLIFLGCRTVHAVKYTFRVRCSPALWWA
jgi:hypothetical protein